MKKTFPVMNVSLGLVDKIVRNDSVELILMRYENIRGVLGNCILMSDGKLKRGFNLDLTNKICYFNISGKDTNKIYWENEEHQEIYFCDTKGSVIIGTPEFDNLTYELKGHTTHMSSYKHPIFNLNGLYKNGNVKPLVGLFEKRENIKGKINFLEFFCDMRDKSGFRPKNMLVKNDKLRLKILEQHYKNFADEYAQSSKLDNLIMESIFYLLDQERHNSSLMPRA